MFFFLFIVPFYIDWGDKWLRSLLDSVVPLAGRCICFEGALKWPLFIAFLTISVNDDNDPTDWIGWVFELLVFDTTLESIEDTVCDFEIGIEFNDDEAFDWLDIPISANGVQRLCVIDEDAERVGAKSKVCNYVLSNVLDKNNK